MYEKKITDIIKLVKILFNVRENEYTKKFVKTLEKLILILRLIHNTVSKKRIFKVFKG